jgi:hypothetical protein
MWHCRLRKGWRELETRTNRQDCVERNLVVIVDDDNEVLLEVFRAEFICHPISLFSCFSNFLTYRVLSKK